MIDRETKRSLGRMMKGVQVVGATHDGASRLYTSHWVCQVSFEEPVESVRDRLLARLDGGS